MALDTVAVSMPGIAWSPEFADDIRSRWPTAHFHQAAYDVSLPWEGCTIDDKVLGTVQVRRNKLGNALRVERSIPKFMYGDNCRVLSVEEATEGVASWMTAIEQTFDGWWDYPEPRSGAKVQRLDLCYQKKVPCAQEVFQGLYKALDLTRTTRHGWQLPAAQIHLTGLTLRRSSLELARWYDKGFESGNESYQDVIRHEEQLRRGKAGYYLDVSGARPVFKAEEARDRMNERYKNFGGGIKGFDFVSLLAEHGNKGAAAVALVLRPDLEPVFKQHLPNGTFYRARNIAAEWRGREFTADLRLPEDAWAQPMVL